MFYFYNDLFFQTVNPVDWTWAVIAGNFIIKLSSWLEDILFRCIFNFSGSGPENIVQENIILYDLLLQGEFSFIIVTTIYICFGQSFIYDTLSLIFLIPRSMLVLFKIYFSFPFIKSSKLHYILYTTWR